MQALETFPPDRASARARLEAWAPRAARHYAARRNYDFGAGAQDGVSQISPYLRHRILTEEDVLRTVLAQHARSSAQKFVDEVFWRTYFKGFLEMRPTIWGAYWGELALAWDGVQTQAGLRARWEAACRGETGIDCFDHWARELVETGYLHNHARMWFASIWLFTLELPLALGADFFLRHLCDGDPASNTLSWRWVGGLHTPGKTYLARSSNIAKYTEGRFRPLHQLASEAPAVSGAPNPERMAAPSGDSFDPSCRSALLLHEDDLSPEWMFARGLAPVSTATLDCTRRLSILEPAPHVGAFKRAALADCVTRERARLGPVTEGLTDANAVAAWARDSGAEQIVTSHPPVGPVADALRGLTGVRVVRLLRPFDARAWPHATAGFFKFKKRIPEFVGALSDIRAA